MTVTSEELLGRVRELLPSIAARARASELERRLNDDTLNELIAADVFRALVPKRFGGHELAVDTLTSIARAISTVCMSTGWVTAFYIGHNWMLTKFPEQAQREVFAERSFTLSPIQPSPELEVKRVPGGVELNGRSPYSSGVMNADWVILCRAGPGDDALACMVPREEVTVDDNWHMHGMAATGSNVIVADGVFVPEHRTMHGLDLFTGMNTIHENPMYAIPTLPFIYCEVMGVYVGGLEGATDAYADYLRGKIARLDGQAMAGKQATHIALGEARANAAAAATLLDGLVADILATGSARAFTTENRLDFKMRAGYLSNLCRQAINDIVVRAGSSNFHVEAPIQRFFRDINMLATHAYIHHEGAYELNGRVSLGLEPNSPLF